MIRTVAGNGKKGFSGDGGLATKAKLSTPCGIAVGSNGEVYFTDVCINRIRKVAKNGLISTIAGNGIYGFSNDGGSATNAQLYGPWGIAVSSGGDIYIADQGNNRIRKIAPNGLISTIAGNGEEGFSGDGREATNAQLCGPCGITTGPGGEIYIADTSNNRIRKVTKNGLISTIAGNGSKGFSGDGGEATHAQLDGPQGIAVGPSGELYIADTWNDRIRKVSKNGSISTIVGNGKPGFSGDGGLATNAQLNSPRGVAVDSSGEIFIADLHNHRIRKVAENGLISTIAGNGFEGFSGDGGEATNAQLYRPYGIAVSSYGEIYIADMETHRIRKIEGLHRDEPIMRTSLKKHERDHTSNGLVYFQPLLAKLAPTFYETILKADTLALNANETRIAQHLIDSLMYGTEFDLDNLEDGNVEEWLFVLGVIGGSEFFEVKTKLLSQFMDAFTEDSIPGILERLDTLKERNMTENSLLSQMLEYTLGRAALTLRSSPTLSTNPIILKYLVQIVPKMSQIELDPIIPSETIRKEPKGIESLFNDSATSDIKIVLGEKLFYCHRTILSSCSPYFEVLFDNAHAFNDLKDDIYPIDCTEFGEELHEMIIKYCYSLFDESVASNSMAIPLFKCASFYGMSQLAEYCMRGITLSTRNYFELIEQLSEYPCEALCTKLVEFGFANLKPLNITEEKLASLPEQIKEKILWRCFQEQVRK